MTSQQINSGGERGEKPHPCINRKDGPPNFKRWSELSSKVINVLSVLALLSVLSGYTHPAQPPQTDEGAAALSAIICAPTFGERPIASE